MTDTSPIFDAANLDESAVAIATGAADATPYLRTITLPAGSATYDGRIWLRKGQSLVGQGYGATVLDLAGQANLMRPVIIAGRDSSDNPDAGGQPLELAGMMLEAGPHPENEEDQYAVFDVDDGVGGWAVHDMFFNGPGLGIAARGGEGQIHDCLFEYGVTHIRVTGHHHQIFNSIFHDCGRFIDIGTGAFDLSIANCRFAYFRDEAIRFASEATGLKSIRVSDCTFEHSTQVDEYANADAAITMEATASELFLTTSTFRNLVAAGVRIDDAAARVFITGCLFSGNGSGLNGQTSTMQGVKVDAAAQLTITDCVFELLPEQPIEIGGGNNEIHVVIRNCRFIGNTNSSPAAEICITNTNSSSTILIENCSSSVRTVVSDAGSAQLKVRNCDTGYWPLPVIASNDPLPLDLHYDAFLVSGTNNFTQIDATLNDRGRKITLIFQNNLTVTDGSNLKLDTNFVAKADRTLTLVSDGTNWFEVSRSYNTP